MVDVIFVLVLKYKHRRRLNSKPYIPSTMLDAIGVANKYFIFYTATRA